MIQTPSAATAATAATAPSHAPLPVWQGLLVWLATATALLLLVFVLAYWTWAWLGPRPLPAAAPGPDAAVRTGAAGGLFGVAEETVVSVAPDASLRLMGIASATARGRGHAVFQINGREIVAVREGGQVAPGIMLVDVRPNQVLLERNGVRQALTWPGATDVNTPAGTHAQR